MEGTKKQRNSTINWALECFKCLQRSMESPHYQGKTEKTRLKDFAHEEKIYRYILIKDNNLTMVYPLTEMEYLEYKAYEKKFWEKNKR